MVVAPTQGRRGATVAVTHHAMLGVVVARQDLQLLAMLMVHQLQTDHQLLQLAMELATGVVVLGVVGARVVVVVGAGVRVVQLLVVVPQLPLPR